MMRKPVTLSESALAELEILANYITTQSYPAYAHKVVSRIRDEIQKIAIFPKAAPLCAYLENTRQLVVGSHLIFYREYEAEISILHILHGARDLEKFFS